MTSEGERERKIEKLGRETSFFCACSLLHAVGANKALLVLFLGPKVFWPDKKCGFFSSMERGGYTSFIEWVGLLE